MAFYNTAHSKRVALNGDLSTKHYDLNFKYLSVNYQDFVINKSRTFGFDLTFWVDNDLALGLF